MRRLEREVKNLKEEYDSLKIKTLCMTDEEKKDQAKFKTDSSKLESLRKQISAKEKLIIEIKLALKWGHRSDVNFDQIVPIWELPFEEFVESWSGKYTQQKFI